MDAIKGIRSKIELKEERVAEINEAITRYNNANIPTPSFWSSELEELLHELLEYKYSNLEYKEGDLVWIRNAGGFWVIDYFIKKEPNPFGKESFVFVTTGNQSNPFVPHTRGVGRYEFIRPFDCSPI